MWTLIQPKTGEREHFNPVGGNQVLVSSCQEEGPVSRDTARILWADLRSEGWVREDSLSVTERESRFFVRYEASGPENLVRDWMFRLCAEYPPFSHGTLVRWETKNGFCSAEAFRMK